MLLCVCVCVVNTFSGRHTEELCTLVTSLCYHGYGDFFFRILVHLCANKNVQELRFLTRSLTASLSKHHVRPHSCGVIANCGFHIDLKGSAADVASNHFRVLEFQYHSTEAERQADSLVLVTSMTSWWARDTRVRPLAWLKVSEMSCPKV